MRADSLSFIEDLNQLSTSTSSGVFPQQYVCERDPVFSVPSGMGHERPWFKNVGFPCSDINSGSCFIPQDEGMSESPVETLEKAIVLRLIWIGGITSISYLERHTELNSSKSDDAWIFLKMDRNPNITVPTRKLALVSCLTSRSVCNVLPSLV